MASSAPRSAEGTSPFPTVEGSATPSGLGGYFPSRTRTRDSSGASSRARSISQKFLESGPPLGFLQATGEVAALAPTIGDIRRGSYANTDDLEGWRLNTTNAEGRRRSSVAPVAASPALGPKTKASRPEDIHEENEGHLEPIPSEQPLGGSEIKSAEEKKSSAAFTKSVSKTDTITQGEAQEFPTGYHFPPKHTWAQATVIGLKAAWKFTTKPLGFLIVLYGLNVVAWGGMLFLLLIPGGGSSRLCHPTCSSINSPRRKWIEVDSQILNALFCVTGFGLIPWRFRDWYYLLQFRVRKNYDALRRLAGINRTWFRLQGSETMPIPALAKAEDAPFEVQHSMIPLPETSIPDPPLTGFRAPPTKLWKLDFVIWAYVANTFLQACLCGFMWGYNRYNRPSWSTGLFVSLACIVAAAGGLVTFIEGKNVKKIEGVPWGVDDVVADVETGKGEKKNKKHHSPFSHIHSHKVTQEKVIA